ncbi:expressed unknown protein [Seminavis robusta]|uniref:Uncharacterized protein n=1 Tax=Seminavis robusta TaxID=568900 RepID=A0A9N8H479_9STRA|nr:expressed unknown protein [Seminavis robusta]|eukprot:Sro43_g025970.1 n/a (202) ;mRNA; f:22015-22620
MKTTNGKSKTGPTKAKETSTKKKIDSANKKKANSGGGKKSKDGMTAEQKILDVIAKLYAGGNKTPKREQVAKLCAIAAKTLANTVAKLKKKDLVECPDAQTLGLTESGLEHVGDLASAGSSNEEVHERIKNDLKGKQVTLFDLLADGEVHEKDDIAEKLGYENRSVKAFANLIGAVKGKGIVIYPTPATIQLDKERCFPFA